MYVEGEITREGVIGQPGHLQGGDYSAGRGGAGNMVPSPRTGTPVSVKGGRQPPPPAPVGTSIESSDAIPETAMREQHPGYDKFHTGRGGGGNIHKDKYGGHSTKKEQEEAEKTKEGKSDGFMAKVKHALGGNKEGEEGAR